MRNKIIRFLRTYLNYFADFQSLKDTGLEMYGREVIELNTREQEYLRACHQQYPYGNDYSLGFHTKPFYYCMIKDVELLGNSGILVRQSKPIVESALSATRLALSVRFPRLYRRQQKTDGLYFSFFLNGWAAENIYHWLIECYPRFVALLQIPLAEKLTVLIPSPMPQYQRDLLDVVRTALEKQGKQIVFESVRANTKYQIRRYLFVPFFTQEMNGYLPSYIRGEMRQIVLNYFGLTAEERKLNKVYISRRFAKKRRIRNEDEVEAFLKTHQYETVYAENLSYRDQVKTFYDATHVLSLHGAGLSNLIYCEPGTKVVEIHAEDSLASHYALLAKSAMLDYTPLVGQKVEQSEDVAVSLEVLQEIA